MNRNLARKARQAMDFSNVGIKDNHVVFMMQKFQRDAIYDALDALEVVEKAAALLTDQRGEGSAR